MKYFVKLVQDDGTEGWINPDHVLSIFHRIDDDGKPYYAINLKGLKWETPITFYGKDIAPLADALRQETVTYTIPIEAVLGPQPKPPL